MTCLEDGSVYGVDYNMDGDIIDSRNRIIRELKTEIHMQRLEVLEEEVLRTKTPALQDAWNQYQTILTLTKVEE